MSILRLDPKKPPRLTGAQALDLVLSDRLGFITEPDQGFHHGSGYGTDLYVVRATITPEVFAGLAADLGMGLHNLRIGTVNPFGMDAHQVVYHAGNKRVEQWIDYVHGKTKLFEKPEHWERLLEGSTRREADKQADDSDSSDWDDVPNRVSQHVTAVPLADLKLGYAVVQRIRLIDFLIGHYGSINRSALMDYFGISMPQASADLATYQQIAPLNIVYDKSQKTYCKTEAFARLFP